MRRRRLLSLAGTALGAAVAGCSGSVDPGPSNETEGQGRETETTDGATTAESGGTTTEATVEATLRISAGFTPRPWRLDVTATDDGTLQFSHLCKRSGEETTERGSIPEREASRLRERLLALDFESVESEYTCDPDSCPTDLPGRTVTLRVGDRHREVYFYQPDPDTVPAELQAIHAQLSRYADRFETDCRPETTEGERPSGEVIRS
jgi:hypothetical protein